MKHTALFRWPIMQRIAARASIRAKIIMAFLISLAGYVILATLLFSRALEQSTEYQINQGAQQSADLLISGIRSQFENARNISYNMIQDADITRWLNSDKSGRDFLVDRNADQVLRKTYSFFPGLESIALINNDGDWILVAQHFVEATFSDIRETTWYEKAVALRGGFFVSLNADDTLLSSQGRNNISLIRQVLSIDTMLPAGFLIVNLNENFISQTTDEIYRKYNTEFYIFDENGNSVIRAQADIDYIDIPEDGEARSIGEETFFLYKTTIPELGWTVVSSTPYDLFSGVPFFPQMVVLPTLSAVVMYLLGMLFTSNLITKPVNELIVSMRGVREGKFIKMPPDSRQDEFGQLKDNYNIMVGELNEQIQQRVLMEQEKRKHELDILGEQIKPHFLYNTLDTIYYLILANHTKSAAEAVNALSRYYRSSLSKGAETVPLSEEIAMIKNYLSLQKIRYGDMLFDEYHIAEGAGEVQVLRNILQPLVENCIYHGIKPSGEPGKVMIRAEIEADKLYIAVMDDGLGMTPEQLERLNNDLLDSHSASFGLRGTIKRLRLFYNVEDIYKIESEPGRGAAVTLKLPMKKGTM